MNPFDIVLAACGGILVLAALGVVYRMVVGPTILDRAISSDSLVTLVVLGMALYTAQAEAAWAGPAMLGLTGLAFIGTVTFARFVAREEPKQGYRPRSLREPSTDTGPHEAIHPDPEALPEEPLNQLTPEEDGEHTAAADRAPGPDDLGAGAAAGAAAGTAGIDADTAGPDAAGTDADAAGADADDAGADPAAEADAAADADDSEVGFGAQPGSRGFQEGTSARWPDVPTEGSR